MPTYSDPGPVEFDAEILREDVDNSQAYVMFPLDVLESYGVKGRVPVTVQFDDRVDYQGSLVTYGQGHLVMVRSDVRKTLGKEPGDSVHVEVRLDTTERVVALEDDITTAFNDASVMDIFRAMSYSHQREYHQWIIGAKKAETRERRIAKAVAMIGDNQRMK